MEEWMCYIFKRGNKYFLVNAESVEDGYNQLQKRFSWNVEIVKREVKFIKTMNAGNNIVELK